MENQKIGPSILTIQKLFYIFDLKYKILKAKAPRYSRLSEVLVLDNKTKKLVMDLETNFQREIYKLNYLYEKKEIYDLLKIKFIEGFLNLKYEDNVKYYIDINERFHKPIVDELMKKGVKVNKLKTYEREQEGAKLLLIKRKTLKNYLCNDDEKH